MRTAGQPVTDAEQRRLEEDAQRKANWKRWGPYLSERQWGTVREDYSADGDCWNYFPHDHARSRAYRWGEDGLLGIHRPRVPAVLRARALERPRPDPQGAPVRPDRSRGQPRRGRQGVLLLPRLHADALLHEGALQVSAGGVSLRTAGRGKPPARHGTSREFELADTGRLRREPLLRRLRRVRQGGARRHSDPHHRRQPRAGGRAAAPAADALVSQHLVLGLQRRRLLAEAAHRAGRRRTLHADHATLGGFRFAARAAADGTPPSWLFTENETNTQRLFGMRQRQRRTSRTPSTTTSSHGRDGRGQSQRRPAPRPRRTIALDIPAGRGRSRCGCACTPTARSSPTSRFGAEFDAGLRAAHRARPTTSTRPRMPAELDRRREPRSPRQAYAGLLWTKQFYHYVVERLARGRSGRSRRRPQRASTGRNPTGRISTTATCISMPDKWEYPWFAAWDLAFHMIPFARIDPDFAKEQLVLLLREWYMHPNGQMPAYEFDFSRRESAGARLGLLARLQDHGPRGSRDRRLPGARLPEAADQLHLVGEPQGPRGQAHLFAGGFLGLDNIGVFDRSKPLPDGGHLEQADGTAWMAFYCAHDALDGAGAGRGRSRPTRTSPRSSSSTSSPSPTR